MLCVEHYGSLMALYSYLSALTYTYVHLLAPITSSWRWRQIVLPNYSSPTTALHRSQRRRPRHELQGPCYSFSFYPSNEVYLRAFWVLGSFASITRKCVGGAVLKRPDPWRPIPLKIHLACPHA